MSNGPKMYTAVPLTTANSEKQHLTYTMCGMSYGPSVRVGFVIWLIVPVGHVF